MAKKIKKEKKKKLESIPKINRRLFKLWSEIIRGRTGYSCEYCGVKRGEKNKDGKPVKIDAHHLMNRDVRNCPLKFSISNGVSVCAKCHKFSPDNSFHMNPVVTIDWLIKNSPERFNFVLNNFKKRVSLDDREVLNCIETSLNNKEDLNIDLLIEISKKNEKIDTNTAFLTIESEISRTENLNHMNQIDPI